MAVMDYLRERFMPHIWCAGCGHGIVMSSLVKAVERLELAKDRVVVSSGIGCSSRIVGYLDFHTLHTLHGRALAFATGVKLAAPELTVLVPMGDGDALAIGGNHFLHSCGRNIDLTAIIMNNRIYGMTGGQMSPLTRHLERSTTSLAGRPGHELDVVGIARAAGATFVARSTVFHARQTIRILTEAIRHKGFSVVEVLSQCPTYYGRLNHAGNAVEMMRWFEKHAVPVGSEERLDDPDRFEIGVFVQEDRPEWAEASNRIHQEGGQ